MKSTTAVKDPVCGMDIETATASGRTEYNGQTYYFCGSKCKEKFDLNPSDMSASAIVKLMLSVFTVSVGFGVVLPPLP